MALRPHRTAPALDQLLVAGESATIVCRAADADGDAVTVNLAAVMDEWSSPTQDIAGADPAPARARRP